MAKLISLSYGVMLMPMFSKGTSGLKDVTGNWAGLHQLLLLSISIIAGDGKGQLYA